MPKYYKLEQVNLREAGKTRDTYRVLHDHCVSGQELIEHMASHSLFSEAVLSGVLMDLAKELGEHLAKGYSVSLPGVGIFSIGIRAKKVLDDDSEHVLNAKSIEFDHVNFRCSKSLLKDVASRCRLAGFERVLGKDGVKIKKPAMLIKGRLASAREYLRIHHIMRIRDYAELVGLSYVTAQRELKVAALDDSSGICAKGKGNQRYYILASTAENGG